MMEDDMSTSTSPPARAAYPSRDAGASPGHGWVTYVGVLLVVGAITVIALDALVVYGLAVHWPETD
jgi:hypothetical protein